MPQDANPEDVLEVLRKGQKDSVVAGGYGSSFNLYLDWFRNLARQYRWNLQQHIAEQAKLDNSTMSKSILTSENNPVFWGLYAKMPKVEKIFWLFIFRFLEPLWTNIAIGILARAEKKTRKRQHIMSENLDKFGLESVLL